MGARTYDEIIAGAIDLAGDSSLSVEVAGWLGEWLRNVALKHHFPGNRKQVLGAVTLGLHTQAVGGGGFSVTEEVVEVLKAEMKDPSSPTAEPWELDISSSVTALGGMWAGDYGRAPPSMVAVSDPDEDGEVILTFNVPPDRAYRLGLLLHVVPDISYLGGLTERPFYPNDETMVQAMVAKCLWHMSDERWIAAEQKTTAMVAQDVLKYSKVHDSTVNMNLGPAFKARKH